MKASVSGSINPSVTAPKYIQTRRFDYVRDPQKRILNTTPQHFTTLDESAKALIAKADTFFVASFVESKNDAQIEGVDVSHRGGRPGFVRIQDDVLTIPEYTGNFHFNTLGNFLVNPKAGLLFSDFASGDLLMLTGGVEIIWGSAEVDAFQGAERAWCFTVDHGLWLRDAMPLRWTFDEYSPNTLITGSWAETESAIVAEVRPGSTRSG